MRYVGLAQEQRFENGDVNRPSCCSRVRALGQYTRDQGSFASILDSWDGVYYHSPRVSLPYRESARGLSVYSSHESVRVGLLPHVYVLSSTDVVTDNHRSGKAGGRVQCALTNGRANCVLASNLPFFLIPLSRAYCLQAASRYLLFNTGVRYSAV